VAVVAVVRSTSLPWAHRVTPLLFGMALAEGMRAMDPHHVGPWTLSGLLLCVAVAVLAARAALLDLDAAVHADEQQRAELASTLTAVRDEADGLTEWREQLTHDARNACAGLRTALSILERYEGQVDPATHDKLRVAAVRELGHIEHLLTRSPAEPPALFEVNDVLRRVAEGSQAIGARVVVQGQPVHAVGRPGDLVAVLKNLLVNVQAHAPGSVVRLSATADDELVRITCADDGPGIRPQDTTRVFERGFRGRGSQGSGLGLYAARQLMEEQGGALVLAPSTRGATFVLTLPRASAIARRGPVVVPSQRSSRLVPLHDPSRSLPVG
jgi:signal transduction histidine kinase